MRDKTRTARLVFCVFVAVLSSRASQGHSITPPLVVIVGANKTETFIVADDGDCAAKITAVANDPTVATVSPAEATAVRQTFTVQARKFGETIIVVHWVGVGGPCTEVGTSVVEVSVRDGPDLTIEIRDLGIYEVGRIRTGFTVALQTLLENQGTQPTSGPITATFFLFAGSEWGRVAGGSYAFNRCELLDVRTVRCETNRIIPPRGRFDSTMPWVMPVQEGFIRLNGNVSGGGDVNLFNNLGTLSLPVGKARSEPVPRVKNRPTPPIPGRARTGRE